MTSREQLIIQPPDQPVPVLLVSPYDDDYDVLPRILNHPHWEWQMSGSCSQAMKLLARRTPAVLFCESDQSDGCWQDLVVLGADMASQTSMIVCSRRADEHLWAEVLNIGGYDVLAKPFDPEEVLRVALGAWHASKRQSRSPLVRPRRQPRGNLHPASMSGAV